MSWKKTLGWAGAILGLLILLLATGGFVVIKTARFHHYVLAKIMEHGENATGGKLEVQNWDLHLSPLTVDLYGIVLHGAEPQGSKPLLQVDKLTVGVSGRSLLHRKLQLSEIVLLHPVANVTVAGDGQNNLPTPSPQKNKGNTTVWDLAIGHILLSNGAVYYNDRKAQLNADLYDLRTEIRFDSLATRYSGTLSYHNGRLQYGNYSPLAHNLDAQFSATPSAAALNSLLLGVGSSRISLRGEVNNYNNPTVKAAYEILIHTQDFAALSPGVSPSGDLHLAGEVHYQNASNQPMLRRVSLHGGITSPDLEAVSPDGGIQLRNLKAQYQLANGSLNVRAIAADLMGGQLAADLGMQRLDTTPVGTLHASLKHLSLESARRSVSREDVKRMPVTGTLDAKLAGSWAGSVKNIRVAGDLGLHAAVWNSASSPASGTPMNATGHLAYDGLHNIITIRQTTLRMPSTFVVVDGQLGNHSDLRVHAIAGDLHQLAALASSLRTSTSDSESQPFIISGTARLDAVVDGSMRDPHVTGQLDADNLEVQGSQWRTARLTLEASPSKFKIQQGSLINARQGDLNFRVEVGLKKWSYLPSSPIAANLSAKAMSLADLERLANREYPITGNLSANISFNGSQLHPSGRGSVRVERATAYSQPIQNLTIQFQAENDSVTSKLSVILPAGSASVNAAYTPKTKAYNVELQAPAIVLRKLQALQAKNLPLGGTLSVFAKGAGTISNPQLDLVLQIPTLQVRQTAITAVKAQVEVRDQKANLSLTSNITQAFVRANATVDLAGAYHTEATIDTNKVPLDPFLAVYAPSMPAGFHGETEVHASLKGPLKDPSRLEAHLTIPTIDGSYQSLQFANTGPIRADYANSVVALAPAEIRGTDTLLRFQGRLPLQNGSAMTLQAQGAVNLALASMFNADIKSAGAIQLSIHGKGTIRQPSVEGKIQIKDASLSTSDAPVGLSKLNGTLDVTKDRIQIKSLKGEMGGGEISAGGSIVYSPAVQFGVALQGKSIRLLYPDGVRTVLDSNLTFTGNMKSASLSGRGLIDSLNFTPDFDLAKFAGQFNGISVPPSGESFADNIKLAIAVQSAQNLSARSTQLSLAGAANLQVTGTASSPVIVGRVDLESGELFFMNNRYQLQRGIITFDDPNETKPILNVQVTSTIQQYNITLTLTGSVDKLTTSYVSDPSLPTADIISLIYRGQTDEEAAAAGTSTDSLLAGQAASRVSSGLQNLAGISSLQIDPLIGGNNTNPSARVAIQQRVTKKLLFTFSTDVSQPQQEIVQGEYEFSKRWSVSVARDELGGVSVDGRLHTKF